MGFGAKVDSKLARGGFGDLLARGARFDFDLIGWHIDYYT